ncbi:MAG: hypothetical protein DLM59_05285 [Pseudonocardiales bacterium]|nr:MAG: hypothetical protein DLM59_05285 [Pseudonocardiales bacterium]
MGVTARLSEAALRADPGAEATCQVTVRNTGTVVDEFAVTVLGESAAWATAEPPSLSLFPDAEGEVTIRLRPPRDASTPQGRIPFGVRVLSKEDAQGSVVEEGYLDVGTYAEVTAEIVPRTSRGRQNGRHEVAIDNRGNAAVEVLLSGADPDEALAFHFTAPSVTAAPGTASFSRFRVSTRSLLWRGTPATIPFFVTVAPRGQQPIRLDASLQQQPMIPAWLPRTIAVCLALVLATAVAWKVVLQPSVRRTVARSPAVQQANQNIQTLANNAHVVLPSPGISLSPSPGGGAAGAGGAAAAAGAFATPVDLTGNQATPGNKRLSTATLVFPPTSKAALTITGITVQNPFNDAGLVTVARGAPDSQAAGLDPLLRVSLFGLTTPSTAFTPPLALSAKETLFLTLTCVKPGAVPNGDPNNPAAADPQCDVIVLVTGFARSTNPGPLPTPSPTPLP